tara:strand:+ start:286 stop:780 length:495 start_codon:yes stop_codon:yes gene_type:complete
MEIYIKRTEDKDYEFLKKWFEEPENNRLFTSEFRNINEYKKMFLLMALSKKENIYYTVFSKTERPIGFVALINTDYIDRSGQIWYVMGDKNYRGKGLMTLAVELFLEIVKDELGLHTVYTWIVEDNLRSIKVLEKNGFSQMGIQKHSFFDGEKFKDKIWLDKIL